MKIYDCFTFFNEVEMLKFRINYLKDIVDYFVIVEAGQTHTGIFRSQVFSIDGFPAEKIRYYFISFPEELPVPQYVSLGGDARNTAAWQRENYQRERLIDGLYDAAPEDIVIVSDVDEIPSRDALNQIKTGESLEKHKILSLSMDLFRYSIRGYCTWGDGRKYRWTHPKVTTRKNLQCTNSIRLAAADKTIEDGGWHFSYFGGTDRIKNKLKAFAHTEMNQDSVLNKVDECVGYTLDLFSDSVVLADTYRGNLPRLIFSEEFRHFFE